MAFLNETLLFQLIYPSLTWKIKTTEKEIFLTFDDGPVPIVTDFVLETLKSFNAKATFFCVGENIKRHSDVFLKVINEGHSIGNHTYNHLNGWATKDEEYFNNVKRCEDVLHPYTVNTHKKLMRPPYGRIRRSQIKNLKKTYKIVMWDVLTKDYDQKITSERCLLNSIKFTRPGSIVVFHDSIKTLSKLQFVLPKYLEHFSSSGYSFSSL